MLQIEGSAMALEINVTIYNKQLKKIIRKLRTASRSSNNLGNFDFTQNSSFLNDRSIV